MSRKNQYAKNSRKKSFLGAISQRQETEGDIKGTLIETGKDALVAIGGGLAGSVMLGKTSLLVGAAVTAIGHYTKNRLATAFGFGMMAAVGLKLKDGAMTGTENPDMLEGIKERAIAFKDSLTEKLFLDKVLNKNQAATSVNGMGDVQYFTYPEEQSQLGANEIDLSVLDQLEQQVAQSAANYRQQQMKGILPSDESMGDMNMDDSIGDLTEDQNF